MNHQGGREPWAWPVSSPTPWKVSRRPPASVLSHSCFKLVAKYKGIIKHFCFSRAWGVETEVSPLLVQVCQHLSDLGLLSSVAENQRSCQHGGHGPLCGPHHHSLHRPQHPFHGHGALPHDPTVWYGPLSWKPGKYILWLLKGPNVK